MQSAKSWRRTKLRTGQFIEVLLARLAAIDGLGASLYAKGLRVQPQRIGASALTASPAQSINRDMDRHVQALIDSGKTEEQAQAICAAQSAGTYAGHFNDAVIYNPTEKTALSVRDGVIEYLGSEINMQPPEQMFTVYRSPATIANAATRMLGIPITDEHVTLDTPAPSGDGSVVAAEMIDASEPLTKTTIAIRNKLAIGDKLLMAVEADKRELSLGYYAELVPHDEYDFEQREIMPHHLAVVDKGRCGAMCSFIDKKGATDMSVKKVTKPVLHKAFTDAEGMMNLQQIVELATALPEAIKSVPVDQLQKLLPALQQIVEASKAVMPAEEPVVKVEDEELDENGNPIVKVADEETEEEKAAKFADAARPVVAAAIKRHTAVIEKARGFVDAAYAFTDKDTATIMRDALATETSEQFADAELELAFKLLKKTGTQYGEFGDKKPGSLTALSDKEL